MISTKDFDYNLPEELIAQTPLEPRDSSRLLVLDKTTGEISHRVFTDIIEYLRQGDALVVNETKVIPARIFARKDTGAHVEVFLLKRENLTDWQVLLKPAKRVKKGQFLELGQGVRAELIGELADGVRLVKMHYEGVFEEKLDAIGNMPLPPYIREELNEKNRYNTVYARVDGSVAAPTAGLHFTPELLERVQAKGVKILKVNLEVGLGTFRPVKAENIKDHIMHTESFHIPDDVAAQITEIKRSGGRIIAVGTTSARALEAGYNMQSTLDKSEFVLKGIKGDTDIFIYPGYKFGVVDCLITNFHLPESTLLMLISALAGRETILNTYEIAVAERYRFFSFGDAMLIL